MTCEILKSCQFFKNTMNDMPKTAEYMKGKLCYADHEQCIRYRFYREFGGENIPEDLVPLDAGNAA